MDRPDRGDDETRTAPRVHERAADSLRPTTRVSGRYRVLGAVGRGGFGEVYRARDEMLERDVALKLLIPDRRWADEDPGFGRFLQEARVVARLDHPHIVPVYDAGLHEGRPWLAMKIIDGESLAAIRMREGRLDPRRAAVILAAVGRALAHAHRRGIVHRDVKPSNILVERDESGHEHAWLLDFGVARCLTGESTWSGRVVVGTPAYMAPEQITGRGVDGRADLFSLGCVGVEIITGVRPFDGANTTEIVARIVHGEPSALDDVERLAGPALAAVIRRLLAKSREDRPSDADEAAAALAAAFTAARRRFRSRARSSAPAWDGRHTILVSGLAKRYVRSRAVIDGLDLEVERGAVFALLGRNGTGKTTLIQTMLGQYRPDRGEVRIFGRDPWYDRVSVIARTGFVPDRLRTYEGLTVGDLLRFVSRFHARWDPSYARHLASRFDLPDDTKVRNLSHGMRTKVSLLAALSHRPDLLVLDDPTVGLDAVVLGEFFETLGEISRREGTTILIATHNVDEVERLATHVGFLAKGRIPVSGRLADVIARGRRLTASFKDAVPDRLESLGLSDVKISGRHVTAVAAEDAAGAAQGLRELGAERVDSESLGLRELFVAIMR